jgi:hypothetical protein
LAKSVERDILIEIPSLMAYWSLGPEEIGTGAEKLSGTPQLLKN